MASALRERLVRAAEVILAAPRAGAGASAAPTSAGTSGLPGAAGLLPPRAPLGAPQPLPLRWPAKEVAAGPAVQLSWL